MHGGKIAVTMYGTFLICCGALGIMLGNIAVVGVLMIGVGVLMITGGIYMIVRFLKEKNNRDDD